MPGEIDGVEVGIEQVDFGAILEDEIDRNHREGELEAHDERRREVEVWRAVPDRGADATADMPRERDVAVANDLGASAGFDRVNARMYFFSSVRISV